MKTLFIVVLVLAVCLSGAIAGRLPFGWFTSLPAADTQKLEILPIGGRDLVLNEEKIERRSLVTWPTPTGKVKVGNTIQVAAGEVFEGNGQMYWGIGNGGQGESQPPMFEVAPGGTVQNVILGAPAGDGIHCMGSCTLNNIWWEDVGEDAATLKGSSASDEMKIVGGGARGAADKTFQHNGPGTVSISNFYAENIGKLYRACGNCKDAYQRNVVVNGVTVKGFSTLVGINANLGDTAKISNVNVLGPPGRVICQPFNAAHRGSEPTKLEGSTQGCEVDEGSITYNGEGSGSVPKKQPPSVPGSDGEGGVPEQPPPEGEGTTKTAKPKKKSQVGDNKSDSSKDKSPVSEQDKKPKKLIKKKKSSDDKGTDNKKDSKKKSDNSKDSSDSSDHKKSKKSKDSKKDKDGKKKMVWRRKSKKDKKDKKDN